MSKIIKRTGYIGGGILTIIGVILVIGLIIFPYSVNNKFVEPRTPQVLITFQDDSLNDIRIGAYPFYMTEILGRIRSNFGGNTKLAEYINASKCMNMINLVWDNLTAIAPYSGNKSASLMGIFNDNIQTSYSTLFPGVSEAINNSVSMVFNETNTNKLINGTIFNSNPLPGILQKNYNGSLGIMAFLSVYANPSIFGVSKQNITYAYNLSTEMHLDAVVNWINIILYPIIPEFIEEQIGFSVPIVTSTTATNYIQLQWAENIIISAGLIERNPFFAGFEISSNFTDYSQVIELWNSFSNISIFPIWISSIEGNSTSQSILQSLYNLTTPQYNALGNWLLNLEPFMQNLLTDELNLPSTSFFYQRLFLEQWMNRVFYPDGLWDGFEIYLKYPLDSDKALNLWNSSNPNAITNSLGIFKWYIAVDHHDSVEFRELSSSFNILEENMNKICDWLNNWRSDTFYGIASKLNLLPSIPIWGNNLKKAVLDVITILSICSIFSVLGGVAIVLTKQAKLSKNKIPT